MQNILNILIEYKTGKLQENFQKFYYKTPKKKKEKLLQVRPISRISIRFPVTGTNSGKVPLLCPFSKKLK